MICRDYFKKKIAGMKFKKKKNLPSYLQGAKAYFSLKLMKMQIRGRI